MQYKPTAQDGYRGITAALIILLLWSGSLFFWLSRPADGIGWWSALVLIGHTFLYTGLFITAHDAMHGVVFPQNKKINNAIGSLAVWLYALFSFKKLHKKHWAHHDHPASQDDPDFHDGEHKGFWAWYLHFLLGYVSWPQLLGMAVIFNALEHLAGVPLSHLLLYWLIPNLLSTLQLFYFGTYLPHREEEAGYRDAHNARSNAYPVWLSFLTCYHFGYHWEHHQFPWVPWWKLPAVRREVG